MIQKKPRTKNIGKRAQYIQKENYPIGKSNEFDACEGEDLKVRK
jgi:hypothetical protein